MLHHVKLGRSLLGYDLVSDLLQLRVKLLKEILKQQRQKLEERTISTYMILASYTELYKFETDKSVTKTDSKAQQCLQSVD